MKGLAGCERPIAHVSLVNAGSFRLDRKIVKGEQMWEATLCDLLFHDNDLRLYAVQSATLRTIIERAVQQRPYGGEFLQVSGLEINVPDRGGATKIESIFLVDQDGVRSELGTTQYYNVATTSYMAMKSKTYSDLFSNCSFKGQVVKSVRDLVTEEIRANGIRIPTNESRWVFKGI